MKIISLKGSNEIAALATMHQSPVLYLYFRSLSALMVLGMSFASSPHVSQLGRKEINVGSLGLVREFCVALLVALRVFRFEQ